MNVAFLFFDLTKHMQSYFVKMIFVPKQNAATLFSRVRVPPSQHVFSRDFASYVFHLIFSGERQLNGSQISARSQRTVFFVIKSLSKELSHC